MPDPEQRNYCITQSYHDFSHALSRVLGDNRNANWSTFACWASKTAGESIRSEELPQVFRELFAAERRIEREMGWIFSALNALTGTDLNLIDDGARAAQEVSWQVGEGNLKVYAELGPLFARFIEALESSSIETSLSSFIDSLDPRDTEAGGQKLLRWAFTHYDQARLNQDAKAKAELMLLGNCLIGLHEQTRLQPNIQGAVDAPVTGVLVDGIASQWPAKVAFTLFGFLGITRESLLRTAKTEWEKLVTRYAMDLALPGGKEIPLGGERVNWPSQIPPDLSDLENPKLIDLLKRFDPNIRVLRTDGADNWTNLDDRMGYIVELFRSSQQDRALFDEPFGSERPCALSGAA